MFVLWDMELLKAVCIFWVECHQSYKIWTVTKICLQPAFLTSKTTLELNVNVGCYHRGLEVEANPLRSTLVRIPTSIFLPIKQTLFTIVLLVPVQHRANSY
jgi:hypothetical protein